MGALISIVVPHYNSSNLIKKLLTSLVIKEKNIFEIIIVDDKSSSSEKENLKRVVSEFPLNIFLYENNTSKKGAGVCRNIGLEKVTSPWILFADSDDHFVDNFYNHIEPYLTKEFDIVYFLPTSQDENGIVATRHLTYAQPIEEYLKTKDPRKLKYNISVVWSKLYRTEMVRKHDIYFDSTLSSNDVLFSVKCDYFAKSFAVDRKVIYSWDFNSKSITTSMSRKRFSDVYDVYVRENNFYRKNLSSIEYKEIRNSAAKLAGIALIRYKFGLFYSVGIFLKLIGNRLVPIRLSDIKISRLNNFFKNNQFYKKEVD